MNTDTLVDAYQRKIEYVRISVTDRCDLRCTYCLPKGFKDFQEPPSWLNFDELTRLVGIFSQFGIKRIRLTGGEPLLRRNLAELSQRLAALPGIEDISLSTNATQLAKHAVALRRAGVKRVNVSLDSLQSSRIEKITGSNCLSKILTGLEAAKDAGFDPIKINMVALQGVNDDEIDAMAAFCSEQGFILRLIETMPMGATGRNAQYLDLQPVRKRLQETFNLVDTLLPGGGPAHYLSSPDKRFNIGFITPMSQHFCAACNRVRLSVDGMLYLCLGQNDKYDFRHLLRSGATDEELALALKEAISIKPLGHEFRTAPHKITRIMSATGG